MTTYQAILDQTMPELEDKHLERYIEAYESGGLANRQCSRCAVGHMCREPGDSEWNGYERYQDECGESLIDKWDKVAAGVPMPALVRVEVVFEGWATLLPGWVDAPATDPQRRRMLYDACVIELAGRRAALLPDMVREAVAQP